MAGVEKLVAALDYDSQAVLYSFTRGEQFDQPFQLTTAPVAFAGRDYGYDPLGRRAAPVAPGRKTTWKFNHPYVGAEGWSDIKKPIIKAIGHGRKFRLEKVLSDGATNVTAPCRLIDFPDSQKPENALLAQSSMTFEQYADWQSLDVAALRWDTGLRWDSGIRWDTIGVTTNIAAQSVAFNLTNNGDVTEREGIITLVGPITGPITLVNTNCDIFGVPIVAGTGTPCRIDIPYTLASGETLVIDSGRGLVYGTHPGIVPWLGVVRWPGQWFYWAIAPGVNACTLFQGAATSGGTINFAFHDRYR